MPVAANGLGEVDGADDGPEVGRGQSPLSFAERRRDERWPRTLERLAGGSIDGGGIGEKALVQLQRVGFVDPSQLPPLGHNLPILAAFKISSVRGRKFSDRARLRAHHLHPFN